MMSPLCNCRKQIKQKIIQKRPSPIKAAHILCFAQSIKQSISRKSPTNQKNSEKSSYLKGISLPISFDRRIKGSMTVEAAIALPLFLFFFWNLGCAIELIRLHGNLELALWETGNRTALYSYVIADDQINSEEVLEEIGEKEYDNLKDNLYGIGLGYFYVKYEMMKYLGEDYLKASPLSNGTDSLQYLESHVGALEDCVEIAVTYDVSPFIKVAGFSDFRMANKYYAHIWNGYRIPGTQGREEVVYVAENGTVYHTDRGCTHLVLSVRQISKEDARQGKNEQHRKYMPCSKCSEKAEEDTVYITTEGDCYHGKVTCPGLKRTVLWLPVSQIGNLQECSRCTQKE